MDTVVRDTAKRQGGDKRAQERARAAGKSASPTGVMVAVSQSASIELPRHSRAPACPRRAASDRRSWSAHLWCAVSVTDAYAPIIGRSVRRPMREVVREFGVLPRDRLSIDTTIG